MIYLDNAATTLHKPPQVAQAVAEALKEKGLDKEFQLKAVPCSGIEACEVALLKAKRGVLDGNFIEGMACDGGCVQGAGCLVRSPRNRMGRTAWDQSICRSAWMRRFRSSTFSSIWAMTERKARSS